MSLCFLHFGRSHSVLMWGFLRNTVVLHKRIYIEIETNHVIPRKWGKLNLRRCMKYVVPSLPSLCSLAQSSLHFTSITLPGGNSVIQVEWKMVAFSLEITAGKTLCKRGLSIIVTLKKSAEISRAVFSSDLFSPTFFSPSISAISSFLHKSDLRDVTTRN